LEKRAREQEALERETLAREYAKTIKRVEARAGRPFPDHGDLLLKFSCLFGFRRYLEGEGHPAPGMAALERRWTTVLHKRYALTEKPALVARMKQCRLGRVEVEIFVQLIMVELDFQLNMKGGFRRDDSRSSTSVERILSALRRADRIKALQMMREEGRLCREGLIYVENDTLPREMNISASQSVVDLIMYPDEGEETFWKVKTQSELIDRLSPLAAELAENAETARYRMRRSRQNDEEDKLWRRIETKMRFLANTCLRHPEWPLVRALDILTKEQRMIVILLLAREMRFLTENETFTGESLATACSRQVTEIRHRLPLLSARGRLRKDDYVQVSGGLEDAAAVEDDATLRTCEFELSGEFLEKLELKRLRTSSEDAREPRFGLESLALDESVLGALRMAVAQARHSGRMLDDWGLGETVHYGRGVTLLFGGPPGVGKTACAEALAKEIGRKIIIADYSQIQNCWVGQTAKNIKRLFCAAAKENAVLFWDEADAMFFDRDNGARTHEIRDVNVLLQEVERFAGVCILATNRKTSLDSALERRITLKVDFARPDAMARALIWRKMAPKKLPLGEDVDFEELAGLDLSGGQIKNVLLNAARRALARNEAGPITREDFLEAANYETKGAWKNVGKCRIGF
jgi:hypothetical protein